MSQLEIGCQRSGNQLQTEGLGPQWPRVEQPSRIRKKFCYGQKNFGSICSSLSPPLTPLTHTRNITLSWIKCESYIFIKKCVRSFIEVVIMIDYPPHIDVLCIRIVELRLYKTKLVLYDHNQYTSIGIYIYIYIYYWNMDRRLETLQFCTHICAYTFIKAQTNIWIYV